MAKSNFWTSPTTSMMPASEWVKQFLPAASPVEIAGGMASTSVEEIALALKWAGKDFTVKVCSADTVGELKRRISELTNVLPKRQKLLNVKVGAKPAHDAFRLSTLSLKPGSTIMMLGTVENEIFVDPVDTPEIVDDFGIAPEDNVDVRDDDVNKSSLQRRIDTFKFTLIHRPRVGRKLLVLDIDYTLYDPRSTPENPGGLMRPHLHEFLTASYSAYDIIVWSATSMKSMETKLKKLGLLGNPNYKITALIDLRAMITIHSRRVRDFICKPLAFIWAKCPEFYNAGNTIMFDDLKRNFVMNPQNGLLIKPFRQGHIDSSADNELVKLTEYLLAIADLEALSSLDHQRWSEYREDL